MASGSVGLFRQSPEVPNDGEGAQRPFWVGLVLTPHPPPINRHGARDNALLGGSQSQASGGFEQ